MWKLFMNSLVLLGVFIALLGFGIDFLQPGTSQSIARPGLIMVAGGLALSLLAATLRRGRLRLPYKGGLGKKLAAAMMIALATLLALEILLSAAGVFIYFPSVAAEDTLTVLPWWVCDAAGCHYDYEFVRPACESGQLQGRVCAINQQGYSDSEDFALPADYDDRTRILLLGDSFTWGMSAELGKSYAETLSAAHPEAIVWNTGIPGTGTNQALLVFDVYAPVLKPQLTILGFTDNDFEDNLLPVDSWLNALDSSGRAIHLRKYAIDEEENLHAFDLDDLEFIQAHHKRPPNSELERLLGMTRLGSLLLRLRDSIESAKPARESFLRRPQVTKQYLGELKQAVAASGSSLLVFLVPRRADTYTETHRYRTAAQLLQELEIPFVNPVSVLHPEADFAAPPDEHWNSAGHQKIGRLISDCVKRFLESRRLASCEYVIVP